MMRRVPAADHQPALGAGRGDRFEHVALVIDQRHPVGGLEHGVGLALHHVDHQRIGQLARDAGIFNPRQLQQLGPQGGKVDQRHRPVTLGQHAFVDLELVEVLHPAHLDPAHLETRLLRHHRQLLARHRRNPRQAGYQPGQRQPGTKDDRQKQPVQLRLAERQRGQQPVEGGVGLRARLADLAAGVGAGGDGAGRGPTALQLLAHAACSRSLRASAMIASTRLG